MKDAVIFCCERVRDDKIVVGYEMGFLEDNILTKVSYKLSGVKRCWFLIDTTGGVWTWRLGYDDHGRVDRKREVVGVNTKKQIFAYLRDNPNSRVDYDITYFDVPDEKKEGIVDKLKKVLKL